MLNTKMLGQRIGDARRKKNISQAQLGEQLFISAQAVGKWERGESMPDIITLNRLAEILGVGLDYFSGETEQPADLAGAVSGETPPVNAGSAAKHNNLKWDMSRGNWADADFSGLKNLHEKFSASNMQRCKFIGSELSGLLLEKNNVDACDFSGSDISHSTIRQSNIAGNNFKNCSLNETEFSKSYLLNCDFTAADFTSVKMKSGGLEKSKLERATWKHTSFVDTYLADITFEGTMDDCYFENCAFKRVTFKDATLTQTFFKCKTLKHLKFIKCKADRMTYEFLKNGKANLEGLIRIN